MLQKKEQAQHWENPSAPADQGCDIPKLLIQEALESGATKAVVISATQIVVDDALAGMCLSPRCENYGLSKSCPPHVSGPTGFKKLLEQFSQGIFFRIDVPTELLYSSQRRELFQLLHEIGAGIEQAAVRMGFSSARAFAGGSCKDLFCHDYPSCAALSKKGKCRNPKKARPSMSGFGIDVAKLSEAAGWTMNKVTKGEDATTAKTAGIYGLVLIA